MVTSPLAVTDGMLHFELAGAYQVFGATPSGLADPWYEISLSAVAHVQHAVGAALPTQPWRSNASNSIAAVDLQIRSPRIWRATGWLPGVSLPGGGAWRGAKRPGQPVCDQVSGCGGAAVVEVDLVYRDDESVTCGLSRPSFGEARIAGTRWRASG
jgi:hypothetical protein